MLCICDPHIHLWDLATGLYPGLERPSTSFIGDNAAIARSYLMAEYLAEASETIKIEAAVHVEAFPTDPLAEVRHLQAMADAAPLPLGIVGHADLTDPGLAALLDRMAAYSGLRGIRQVLNFHANPLYSYVARDLLAEPAFRRGFAELGPRGLSFDLQLYPHQTGQAAALAAAHPCTQIILNHAGMWVDRDAGGWRRWKTGLRLLACCPNVAVKISGLGMFDTRFTIESLRPLVLETIDAFGPDRCMFASNFPVDKLFSTYAELWNTLSGIIADFPASERDAMLCGNARTVYRI
jgi:predicted TIM-barrel fold metal-dependent hydrolase